MKMPRGKHRQKKETSALGNESKHSPGMQSSNTDEMIHLESNGILLGSKQMALELVKCVSAKEEERWPRRNLERDFIGCQHPKLVRR